MSMNIVLVEPEIPQNTGNIARTCAATGTVLHLIEPLGFSLADRYLKRAGLDYWNLMEYHVYRDLESFLRQHPGIRAHYATTKAPRGYHEAEYRDGDYLFFGRETRGLPENLLEKVYDHCIRIPMLLGGNAILQCLLAHAGDQLPPCPDRKLFDCVLIHKYTSYLISMPSQPCIYILS
jgi:tRNA (cytidine/uridine-2'-O-)-methyltransferase